MFYEVKVETKKFSLTKSYEKVHNKTDINSILIIKIQYNNPGTIYPRTPLKHYIQLTNSIAGIIRLWTTFSLISRKLLAK